MFDLDFSKLIYWLTWSPLRHPRLTAWLNALLAPVKSMHSRFGLFRKKTWWDIHTSGQVCRLRAGLNREFDPGLKRFLIEDAVTTTLVYAFLASENQPLFLPAFLSGAPSDFVVKAPVSLAGQEIQIRAYVNKFKLPGKRYSIVWI